MKNGREERELNENRDRMKLKPMVATSAAMGLGFTLWITYPKIVTFVMCLSLPQPHRPPHQTTFLTLTGILLLKYRFCS